MISEAVQMLLFHASASNYNNGVLGFCANRLSAHPNANRQALCELLFYLGHRYCTVAMIFMI
jgi:hypothetical protein